MMHLDKLKVISRTSKEGQVEYWHGKSTRDFGDYKVAYVLLEGQTDDWMKWLLSWESNNKEGYTYKVESVIDVNNKILFAAQNRKTKT